MSVIIDGMDQAKTKIPNPVRHSKDTEHLFRQAVHVTGILDHGAEVPAQVILEDCRASKDSNNTINSLCYIIRERAMQGPLPEIFNLQLDNAAGENKNKFVLFFCALLVGAGVFRKVKLSFLPVGHTQEDIDQLFSRLAEALRRKDCNTWADLESIIASSYTSTNGSKPRIVKNPMVPDFKTWMSGIKWQVQGHSTPMCFKFVKNDEDDVVMYARGRTSVNVVDGQKDEDSLWFPEDGYVIVSTHDAMDLWRKPLFRVPVRSVPTADIRHTVQKYVALDMFQQSTVDTWDEYLASVDDDIAQQCAICRDLREQEAKTNQVSLLLCMI